MRIHLHLDCATNTRGRIGHLLSTRPVRQRVLDGVDRGVGRPIGGDCHSRGRRGERRGAGRPRSRASFAPRRRCLLVVQVPLAVRMDREDHEQRVGRRPGVGRLKRRSPLVLPGTRDVRFLRRPPGARRRARGADVISRSVAGAAVLACRCLRAFPQREWTRTDRRRREGRRARSRRPGMTAGNACAEATSDGRCEPPNEDSPTRCASSRPTSLQVLATHAQGSDSRSCRQRCRSTCRASAGRARIGVRRVAGASRPSID
jgi:hypothetical protein